MVGTYDSLYRFTIAENAGIGDAAGTVNPAQNGDQSRYKITSGNTNSSFTIDSVNGIIRIAKQLDHHTQDTFNLVVEVTDTGAITKEVRAEITVTAESTPTGVNELSWQSATPQPYATHEVHGEVVKGKLYVFGGYDVLKRPKYIPTKRAYVYDPVAKTWSAIADLPHTPKGADFGGITHEGLTTDGTDIYFAGGYPCNSNGTGQAFGTREVWKYNVASNSYSPLPPLPVALATGQLRYLKGKLHYMGGANKSRRDTSIHLALDLDNLLSGWKVLAPVLNATNHPGSTVFENKIYYMGGSHHQDAKAIQQKTVEVYDPNTNGWTILADLPVALDHISSSVLVVRHQIVVLGGEATPSSKSKIVSAYSPATDTWQNLSPLPSTRAAGVAGYLNGAIYYCGGNFNNTNFKGTIKDDSVHLFTFTGTGKWSTAANWRNNAIPPVILPAGDSILIDGQCILDTIQTIQRGAAIKVAEGKSLLIPGSLKIE